MDGICFSYMREYINRIWIVCFSSKCNSKQWSNRTGIRRVWPTKARVIIIIGELLFWEWKLLTREVDGINPCNLKWNDRSNNPFDNNYLIQKLSKGVQCLIGKHSSLWKRIFSRNSINFSVFFRWLYHLIIVITFIHRKMYLVLFNKEK